MQGTSRAWLSPLLETVVKNNKKKGKIEYTKEESP